MYLEEQILMKEYIKEYQKMREITWKIGVIVLIDRLEGIWRSNQNFRKVFDRFKVLSDKVLRIKLYSNLLLDDIQYFAYYAAFLGGD